MGDAPAASDTMSASCETPPCRSGACSDVRAAVLHKETDPATGNTVASLDPKKSSLGATRVCIGHEIGLGTYAVQAFRPVTGKPGSEELVGSVEKVRLQELADTIMRVAGIRPQE